MSTLFNSLKICINLSGKITALVFVWNCNLSLFEHDSNNVNTSGWMLGSPPSIFIGKKVKAGSDDKWFSINLSKLMSFVLNFFSVLILGPGRVIPNLLNSISSFSHKLLWWTSQDAHLRLQKLLIFNSKNLICGEANICSLAEGVWEEIILIIRCLKLSLPTSSLT